MQFLTDGVVNHDEAGIYISMEETEDEIRENFGRYGWDLTKVVILSVIPQKVTTVEETKFVVPSIELETGGALTMKRFSIEMVKDFIKKKVRESGAKRLVLDSIPSLAMSIEDPFTIRQEILQLSSLLKELGCTSIVLTEIPEGQKSASMYGVEEFMAPAVIVIYNVKKGGKRVRALEILKMRGTNHSQDITMMDFTQGGIMVFPGESLDI
jgi:KaiC/GvpD/RAD55 family RecA-like ATPase